MSTRANCELDPSALRWRCTDDMLDFSTTDELAKQTNVVGQERAVKAIELGLEVKSPGYNIFVTGLVGTGKKTTIKQILERFPSKDQNITDSLFVYNFKTPDTPHYISLPTGEGKLFKKQMQSFVESLKKQIPKIFESSDYQERKKKLDTDAQEEAKQITKSFEAQISKQGFQLVQIRMGPVQKLELFIRVNGKAMSMRELELMAEKGEIPKRVVEEKMHVYQSLKDELESLLKSIRGEARKYQEMIVNLNKESVTPLVKNLIQDIKDAHNNEAVHAYLCEVLDFVVENSDRFTSEKEEKEKENPLAALLKPPPRPLAELQVNLLVDNSELKGPPIVLETHPSFKNLFGGIERGADGAESDHTNIKAGSLLKAHGGYLVLNAHDVLIENGVWPHLKRTLRTSKLEIQNSDSILVLGSRISIKPQPVPIDLKVLMIGDGRIYSILYEYEEDFLKIFKVKAEFNSEARLTRDNLLSYAKFIKTLCDDEKLRPFNKPAVAAVCEFAVRLAGRQNKISAQISLLADVVRESNHWAAKAGSSTVEEKHVDKALDERIYRVNLIEDKLQELITEGMIKVDVQGAVIGQINGLSVISLGDYSFGRPSRITATTSIGKEGVISIERNANMSGRIHNKGLLVISGFISSKFAQDKPLVLTARICFEQNYSGIDGDSASSTEIYALLSSLSGVKLRQDIAVTGSVSQLGEVQPIGGVNEKIEGFYDVCKALGFSGTQGVMIPSQNTQDLMLRKDIIKDVEAGRFHIYAIKNIEEGIEILTGKRAGVHNGTYNYEDGSIYQLCNLKLQELLRLSEQSKHPKRGQRAAL